MLLEPYVKYFRLDNNYHFDVQFNRLGFYFTTR